MKLASSLAPLVPVLLACACVAPPTGTDAPASGGGSGAGGGVSAGGSPPQAAGGSTLVVDDGTGGVTDPGSMPDCDSVLEVIFRDFNASHPDFEEVHQGQDDVGCGMVMPTLDTADGKRQPVFQASIGTGQRMIDQDGIITCITPWPYVPPGEITSGVTFAEWYNDVPDVNMTIEATLDLMASGDTFVFDSAGTPGFFPLDGQGFAEQTQGHNFHFTTEAHVRFGYQSGQVFTFSGDDDLWIFVNDKLALDLGGLHSPLTATLDFDAQAAALGIVPGNTYNMDIFHAERHTSASNFRIETNISCFTKVVVVR
jgi:fibro-slime domain-containing protein